MKKVLVKNKIITQEYKAPVLNELGEVLEAGIPEQFSIGDVIAESGIMKEQEEIDFFISQRPQYICEVVDMTVEVDAKKAKKDKRKAAKNKFKNFDKSKLTTIAACREVIADIVDMLDDGEQD